ncbi:MAG: hypothetical protein J07AB43_05850, partial [Candidatus Nanosalina sp. J07AB43]
EDVRIEDPGEFDAVMNLWKQGSPEGFPGKAPLDVWYKDAVPEEDWIEYRGGNPPVSKKSGHVLNELFNTREIKGGRSDTYDNFTVEKIGSFIEMARNEGVSDESIVYNLGAYASATMAEMNYGEDPNQSSSRLKMSRPDEALALYAAGEELLDVVEIETLDGDEIKIHDPLKRIAEGWTGKFLDMVPEKYTGSYNEIGTEEASEDPFSDPKNSYSSWDYIPEDVGTAIEIYSELRNNRKPVRDPNKPYDPSNLSKQTQNAVDLYHARIDNDSPLDAEEINAIGWQMAHEIMEG